VTLISIASGAGASFLEIGSALADAALVAAFLGAAAGADLVGAAAAGAAFAGAGAVFTGAALAGAAFFTGATFGAAALVAVAAIFRAAGASPLRSVGGFTVGFASAVRRVEKRTGAISSDSTIISVDPVTDWRPAMNASNAALLPNMCAGTITDSGLCVGNPSPFAITNIHRETLSPSY
jgi:hypothetical protein